MKPPQINSDIFEKLCQAAIEFRSLRPWDILYDDQVFGVQDPESKEIGYCCVMGAGGEVFGLALYRGRKGLDLYQKILNRTIDPEKLLVLQDALLAEFCDRADLEKEDRALLKSIDFKPLDSKDAPAYPIFRSYKPGYAPWFISEREAKWLTFAFQCAVDLLGAFVKNDLLLEGKADHYLIYSQDKNAKLRSSAWRKIEPYSKPVEASIPINEVTLQRIRNLQITEDTEWEMDIFFLSDRTILDQDRPYFPQVVMIVHQQTGMVLNMNMFGPDVSIPTISTDFLLQTVEKYGRVPREIHIQDKLVWESLKPIVDQFNIQILLKDKLPVIREVKEALMQDLRQHF